MIQFLRYRLNYWVRVLCHLFGFCPRCGERVSSTQHGTVFCSSCGAR